MDRLRIRGECWELSGYRDRQGYSLISPSERGTPFTPLRGHRLAWEYANGAAIPEGLRICHHCDNPPCVRPSHLFLGTPADNNRDCMLKGRRRTKPQKLNPALVREIRGLKAHSNPTNKLLGAGFGVSANTVARIVRREIWKYVE